MILEEFKQLVTKHRPTGYALGEFKTDTPDYRFGKQNQTVAMIYDNSIKSAVKFTFRVGLTSLLIKKFNELGAHAIQHPELRDMFLVTIGNNAFSDEMIGLLEESIIRALRKFYQ
ncbi:hypothetical protein ACO1PK_14780 [Alishewanella sp. d11]|uniref:hypothetical protein n=1 Tax=Alishewanella sp. d11 TaxID=3414030 RepID=UPI003BF86E8A